MAMSKVLDQEQILLLQYAYEHDIFVQGRIQEMRMTSIREAARAMHPYNINPPAKKGDRWRTNYKLENGKFTTLRAATEEGLLDKLVERYLPHANIKNKTFHNLYEEWILYKEQVTASPNTILRHKQHYNKYLATSKLDNAKMSEISELLLETECNRIVKDFSLSSKEWVNVKTILNGMYEYARRMKYITENPIQNIKITVRFRQIVKKTGRTQTYNTEERAALNKYLDEKYAETEDVAFMAIRINFMMGLRVGELVALKWEDIEGRQLHVVREEVKDRTNNSISVANHTKTNTDRYVYLIPEALDMLRRLPREGEYIFMRDGKRLTSRKISYVLEKYAERNGLQTKSSHKMRKTYASMCNANGVPIDFIREQLGHSSLSTTYGYIYNPLTEEESYQALTNALSTKTEPVEQDVKNVVSITSRLNEKTLSHSCPNLSHKFRAK